MSAPFLQFYVADYLADTQHLTTEQHGAYLLILFAMWRADGAELDADDSKLARIARLTLTRWNRIKGDVMALLTIESGRVTQKRLRDELQKAEEKSQKRSAAGRNGGHAKALKDKDSPLANASVLPRHSSEPEPEPEPEKKKEKSPSLRSVPSKAKGEPEGFPEFYDAFPLHKARPKAAKAYADALKAGCSPADMLAGARRYATERRGEDQRFTAYPATWLNQRRWQDETTTTQIFPGGRNGTGSSNRPQSGASTAHQRHLEGLALLVDEADRAAEGDAESGQLAFQTRLAG